MHDQAQIEEMPLIGTKEVLRQLEVSHKTLVNWIEKGWIVGAQRVGKAFVFRKDYRIKREALRFNVEAVADRLTD